MFRGIRLDNTEWVYGDLLNIGDAKYIQYYTEPTECNEWCLMYKNNSYLVHPKTVGQHSGLTDHLDNKVFKGDIFIPFYITPFGKTTVDLDEDRKGIVIFEKGAFLLQLVTDSSVKSPLSHFVVHNTNRLMGEVVGNIYENES